MNIWFLSDIHLELTRPWDLPPPDERPEYDVLVVAGDLVPKMERGVAWLAQRVMDRPVIYVPGNHEWYGTDLDRSLAKARSAAEGTNIIVMDHDVYVLNGVRFLAATLWTDFNLFGRPDKAMADAALGMNDYRRIRKQSHRYRLRPQDTQQRHMLARIFLATHLAAEFDGTTVVVTHHAPYPGAVLPRMADDVLAPAYASDLTDLVERFRPDLWIYGHCHDTRDVVIARTRIVTNAKGYGPWMPERPFPDNPAFDPRLTVSVTG